MCERCVCVKRPSAVKVKGSQSLSLRSAVCMCAERQRWPCCFCIGPACLPACVCVCVSVCPLSLTWSAAVFHNMQEMGLIFSRRRRCTDFTSRLQSRLTEAQTEGVGETRQALVDKAGENMLVLITQIDPQAKHGTHNTNAEQSSDTPT